MASRSSTTTRNDMKFIQEINDIINKRVKIGKEEAIKRKTPSRITKAITRHPLFPKIKQDIINADLP